jgi:hypothetical protein
MGEMRNSSRILIEKPKGKRPLGGYKLSREDNIKTDLTEVAWEGKHWFYLHWDRDQWQVLVKRLMSLVLP